MRWAMVGHLEDGVWAVVSTHATMREARKAITPAWRQAGAIVARLASPPEPEAPGWITEDTNDRDPAPTDGPTGETEGIVREWLRDQGIAGSSVIRDMARDPASRLGPRQPTEAPTGGELRQALDDLDADARGESVTGWGRGVRYATSMIREVLNAHQPTPEERSDEQ